MFKTPENPHSPPLESAPADFSPAVAKVLELTETLQRVQADFENYRKRVQNEMNVNYLRGKATALKDMLSFMDTLDSAIDKEKNDTRNALENIRTHALHILLQNGVKPIQTMGKTFDPFTSECLMQGNDAKQNEDVVLEEMQRGYYFHDDVLRPAKVKVNKHVEKENTNMNEKINTSMSEKENAKMNEKENISKNDNQPVKNFGGNNHE